MPRLTILAACLALLLPQCGSAQKDPKTEAKGTGVYTALDDAQLQKQLSKLAPFTLKDDADALTASEKALLQKIVAAGKLLDDVYLHQSFARNRKIFAGLKAQYAAKPTPENRRLLEYYWICKGPYDVFNEYEPFMGGDGAVPAPMPPSRNFYPTDLTADAFNEWVKGLGEKEAAAAKSDFTAIQKTDGGKLKAVAYSEAYAEWLKPLAATLRSAAGHIAGNSLAAFLEARAKAFEDNDYETSDGLWISMNGIDDAKAGNIDITIGPYENYADELMKRKAAFQLYVGVLRPSKTAQLKFYSKHIHKMDDRLWELYQQYWKEKREVASGKSLGGGAAPVRWGKPGAKVTLVAVDLAYSAGYANEQYQTLAFNLPNIAAWQEKFGTKKVMMMNMLDGKFQHILDPISKVVMTAGELPNIDQDLFSDNTVRHEVAHGIGPSGITVDGKKTTVRERHQKYYSPFEEAKAEVVSLLFGYWLADQGLIKDPTFTKKMAATYTASTFRTVRFGATSDHARGKVFEFNRLVQNGGIKIGDGKFSVDHTKFPQAVEKLAMEIMDLQMQGTSATAKALLDSVGKPTKDLTDALAAIDAKNIPVDLRVRYTFGENWGVIAEE